MNATTLSSVALTIRPPVRPGQLSVAQREAVCDYRERNGRSWKDKLATCWATGKYGSTDKASLLQQVRNELGPQWLERVASRDLEIKPIGVRIDAEIARIQALSDTGHAFSLLHDIRDQIAEGKTLIDIRKDFEPAHDDDDESRYGYNHQKAEHEKGMGAISKFIRVIEDEIYVLHDFNDAQENVSLITEHDAAVRGAAPAAAMPNAEKPTIYSISINREGWTQATLETGIPHSTIPVVDRVSVNEGMFVNLARSKGISEISSPSLDAPYVWYASPLPTNSQASIAHRHALHVHTIDGREPTALDYQDMADKLGITLEKRLDAEASNACEMAL